MTRLFGLVLLTVLLASCGQVTTAPSTTSTTNTTSPQVNPVFAFSEAVVGKNRIALGLIQNGSPVNDPAAQVRLRFFDLTDPSATMKTEAQATYYGAGLPAAVYVAYADLPTAGSWGVEVQTTLNGFTTPSMARLRLEVLPTSTVPNIGAPAIPVKTLTVRDVADPAQLASASPNLALYQISLDDALKNGKPTVVYFGTPGFCRTAVCGPGLQVLSTLQQRLGNQLNVIHVEVYNYPFSQAVEKINTAAAAAQSAGRQLTIEEFSASFSPPMVAWNLATEPWLYLIDARGIIQARYEGGITTDELGPVFERLAAGQPVLP